MERDLAPFGRVLLAAALALAALATLPSLAAAAELGASPPSVSFSQEIVGKRSSAQTVTISNTLPGAEGVEGLVVGGADFVELTDTCENTVVLEGQSCEVSIAFEPQAGGSRLGALEMNLSGGSILVVPLSGTGVVSRITVPAAESFAATTVGSTTTQQIPLKNQGETDLNISDIKLEGADPGDFKLESNCNGPLPKGAGCQLSVGFLPTATGERTAQLKVVSDGVPSEQFVALSGEGIAPSLGFEPTELDFGLVEVHSGNQQMLTLRNTGPSSVQLGNVEIAGPDTNEFFIPNNNCSGTQLSPLQTCSIQVQFNANNEGSYNAAVRVGAAGGFSFEAPLKGRAERPEVTPSEMPLAFDPTGVGAGRLRELTLTNTGNLPVGFFIAIVSGGDVSSFQLVEEHCTGRLIMPGDSCLVEVRFRPSGAGPKQATLSFFGSGDGAIQLPVEGLGTAPRLTLSPSSFDFGTVAAGAVGPRRVFELRNDSADPYAVDSVGLGGADLGEFSIRGDDCTETLLTPGEACRVSVRFEPESSGAKTATLRLRGEAGPIVAQLRGEGTAPAAAATSGMAAAAPSAPAPAASNRLVLQLSSKAKLAGGRRLLIGSARCESSQPCVVRIGGRAAGMGKALVRSRQTVGAGASVPLAVTVPAELRDGSGGGKLVVTVRWRSGEARGSSTRTFALPR